MPGLDSILGLISAVETVERNLENGDYIRQAVGENEEKIVEMNVAQLYDWGVTSVGISINTYRPYTPYTISIKEMKGTADRSSYSAGHGSFSSVFYG